MAPEPDRRFAGMSVTERLFEAGMLADFDAAARLRDREALLRLLVAVGIDGAGAAWIADRILLHPEHYGY